MPGHHNISVQYVKPTFSKTATTQSWQSFPLDVLSSWPEYSVPCWVSLQINSLPPSTFLPPSLKWTRERKHSLIKIVWLYPRCTYFCHWARPRREIRRTRKAKPASSWVGCFPRISKQSNVSHRNSQKKQYNIGVWIAVSDSYYKHKERWLLGCAMARNRLSFWKIFNKTRVNVGGAWKLAHCWFVYIKNRPKFNKHIIVSIKSDCCKKNF